MPAFDAFSSFVFGTRSSERGIVGTIIADGDGAWRRAGTKLFCLMSRF